MTVLIFLVAVVVLALLCAGMFLSVLFDVLMALGHVLLAVHWVINRMVVFVSAVVKLIQNRMAK